MGLVAMVIDILYVGICVVGSVGLVVMVNKNGLIIKIIYF